MGEVKCGKIVRGKCHPRIDGFETWKAWSRSGDEARKLSPMLLGGEYDGFEFSVFENYWQGSKIYECDIDTTSLCEENILKPQFHQRRHHEITSPTPKRRTFPKRTHGTPIAGYYLGEIMGYIESRKRIYCPLYESLVQNHPTFLKLKAKVEAGENLLIIGPDGRDDVEITEEAMEEAINNQSEIFGHELVLCCMLKGIKVWDDLRR